MRQTLGTQLRHLIELLDGAVAAAYEEAGLRYRPRYTPVMRALMTCEPSTIGHLAEVAGITQPAATQTVALMVKEGIVSVEAGPNDGRQRMIHLTKSGRELIPQLALCWQATNAAASSLDAELPYSLSDLVDSAIKALETKPFGTRIHEARAQITESGDKPLLTGTTTAAPSKTVRRTKTAR
jgi:DNA-binding MarR family transcriptional regulator